MKLLKESTSSVSVYKLLNSLVTNIHNNYNVSVDNKICRSQVYPDTLRIGFEINTNDARLSQEVERYVRDYISDFGYDGDNDKSVTRRYYSSDESESGQPYYLITVDASLIHPETDSFFYKDSSMGKFIENSYDNAGTEYQIHEINGEYSLWREDIRDEYDKLASGSYYFVKKKMNEYISDVNSSLF